MTATSLPPAGWQPLAACRDADAEIFFPVGEQDPVIARAKRVCSGCEVSGPCLDYATATGQDHGIWGGTTPDDRRAARRRELRAARRAAV